MALMPNLASLEFTLRSNCHEYIVVSGQAIMSIPPKIQCFAGCGNVGDPDLSFFCVDCHADRAELEEQRALQRFLETNTKENQANKQLTKILRRRAPPALDHRKALFDFLERPRERDPSIVAREIHFLERELQIREACKQQLQRYMLATDYEDEERDRREWHRYLYGAPQPVPRNDMGEEAELKAQRMLYCYWQRRALNKRIKERIRIREEREKEAKQTHKRKQKGKTLKKVSISSAI